MWKTLIFVPQTLANIVMLVVLKAWSNPCSPSLRMPNESYEKKKGQLSIHFCFPANAVVYLSSLFFYTSIYFFYFYYLCLSISSINPASLSFIYYLFICSCLLSCFQSSFSFFFFFSFRTTVSSVINLLTFFSRCNHVMIFSCLFPIYPTIYFSFVFLLVGIFIVSQRRNFIIVTYSLPSRCLRLPACLLTSPTSLPRHQPYTCTFAVNFCSFAPFCCSLWRPYHTTSLLGSYILYIYVTSVS